MYGNRKALAEVGQAQEGSPMLLLARRIPILLELLEKSDKSRSHWNPNSFNFAIVMEKCF